ncbi:hypothetical protein GCM10009609_55390 [Pseudonocardia aurantiaca]
MSIRGTCGQSSASAVAALTATRAAGTARTRGSRGQSTSSAVARMPTTSASGCIAAAWPGSASRLSTGLAGGLAGATPPSTTCSCASAIDRPIPASMPCTTAGGMAWTKRAMRNIAKAICSSPAPMVTRQVTCQPNRTTSSATTTVRPAAGPVGIRTGLRASSGSTARAWSCGRRRACDPANVTLTLSVPSRSPGPRVPRAPVTLDFMFM